MISAKIHQAALAIERQVRRLRGLPFGRHLGLNYGRCMRCGVYAYQVEAGEADWCTANNKEPEWLKKISLVAAALLVTAPAYAQYTYVQPNYGGGYTINTPGARNPYSYVTPNYGGGYTINTPGAYHPYTYVTPSFNGGYTINTPGAGFGNYELDRGD